MKQKSVLYIVGLLLGLLMIAKNHLDHSFGEFLFKFIGLSPWTNVDKTGFNLPVIIGFLLILFGVSGTARTYRPRFPIIFSSLIIGCIAFVLISPIASEKAMFLLKHNSKGIHSLDYSIKDSKCYIQTVESVVKSDCSFTIYNYGKEENFMIKPMLMDSYTDMDIDVQAHMVSIAPHRKHLFSVQFDGTQRNENGFGGSLERVGIELEVGGVRKRFE
ncbi:hypothetical protein [Paenibacillus sp. YIM B09110]|uniref:hypothetical protein n=1 Tax=Paenibacillus sp. YIM B09110 TaxID=3126102 RepID=UPI00301E2666